ncbi:MAG: hypothetical protein V4614_10185 [Pseudomonadota bacterium]
MELIAFLLLGMAVLGAGSLGAYRFAKRKAALPSGAGAALPQQPGSSSKRTQAGELEYQVSYAPPEFEWSGNSTGSLPVKTLTYKQYECLEDGRYGFRIVGVSPTERDLPQPHKTRAHGLKTVASLSRHGFLQADPAGGYVITDLGLNALAICSVRY